MNKEILFKLEDNIRCLSSRIDQLDEEIKLLKKERDVMNNWRLDITEIIDLIHNSNKDE